jgi:hypothetical protein
VTHPIAIAFAVCLAACLLAGCAERRAVRLSETTSQITLSPGDVRFTRIAEGEDCVTQVLGIQLSSPSFQVAERRALTSAAAEHLLDLVTYEGIETGFYFPNPLSLFTGLRHRPVVLYAQHCVYVEGHGISRGPSDRRMRLP